MERYYNFWRRLGAGVFDALMMMPISMVIYRYANLSDAKSYFLWTTVIVMSSILYNILLTGLAGQTIGKIVMGLKVLDHSNETSVIGIKRAFYRESVPTVLQLLSLGYWGFHIFYYQPETNDALEIVEDILDTAVFWWFFAELVTMFFNQKRRAIHDFLASSVVISIKGLKYDKHYETLHANAIDTSE